MINADQYPTWHVELAKRLDEVTDQHQQRFIVSDIDEFRYLHFKQGEDTYQLQTVINRQKPQALFSSVLHFMASSILLADIQQLDHVILFGLGGGSLLHFIQYHWHPISIDVIEHSQTVIDLYEQYFSEFSSQPTAIIHQQEASLYIETNDTPSKLVNLIFINFIPNHLSNFYQSSLLENLKQKLASNGLLMINAIFSSNAQFKQIYQLIRSIFHKQCLCIEVPDHQNVIIICFKEAAAFDLNHSQLCQLANSLKQKQGLAADVFFSQLWQQSPCIYQDNRKSALSDILPKHL